MLKTKLDWALAHAREGFSVFPLSPNSKVPPAEMTRWQYRATTDEARIREWWARWPDANIAGFTGALFVVDIDPRNGGKATFEFLTDTLEFPKTRVSKTAGGGNHIIYALPPSTVVRTPKAGLGPGIDLKSWGGYVVLPGSTIDGVAYEWLNDRAPAMVPQWMLDQCTRPQPKSDNAGVRLIEENDVGVAMAEAYIRNYAEAIPEGNRDDTAYVVACTLYDFALEDATAHGLLTDWNETRCIPPLDATDIARIVRSAKKTRRNAIGNRNPEYHPGIEPVPIAPRAATESNNTTKFRSVPAAEGAKLALSKRGRFLVKGLLDCGGMSVMYGESGSGKTFMAQDVAYHIASGKEWNGRRIRRGAVVYLAAEGGQGIYARLAALEAHYGPLDDVWLHTIPVAADFIHGAGDIQGMLTEIRRLEACHGQKVELIVVDTLSRAMAGGDENSSTDMGAMVKALDYLRMQAAAHVLVVHHTGKDKAKGARGHSLLRAATDTEIEIDNYLLSVTKQRDMESKLTLGFRLTPVQIGVDEDNDPVTSCTIELRYGPLAQEEPGTLTGECAQFATALRTWLLAEYAESAAVPDKLPFKTIQAVVVAAALRPANARVHREKPRAFRQTVNRLLQEMHENAHIKNVSKGQWLLMNAQNAQNEQHIQVTECTDAHGSIDPCITCVTDSTGEDLEG